MGGSVRTRIVETLKAADDVIISHFDGDHCPLADANPYQLALDDVKQCLREGRIWAKGPASASPNQQRRRVALEAAIGRELSAAEGGQDGPLAFSFPVPHGTRNDRTSTVMMSRIEEDGVTFVHASDIQLLDKETVGAILDWEPDIVLASGPPLYRFVSPSSQAQREQAWNNAFELATNVDTLIIDHHLLRSREGIQWLEQLNRDSKGTVLCAAEFMRRDPLFLEAWRKELYEWVPVPGPWHDAYSKGNADTDDFRQRGWEALIAHGRVEPCCWYAVCPIKYYTERGRLDRYWIEKYCLVRNRNCVRYQMEESGQHHPDNMLPNGDIREDL